MPTMTKQEAADFDYKVQAMMVASPEANNAARALNQKYGSQIQYSMDKNLSQNYSAAFENTVQNKANNYSAPKRR